MKKQAYYSAFPYDKKNEKLKEVINMKKSSFAIHCEITTPKVFVGYQSADEEQLHRFGSECLARFRSR